jgi:hypothetical protein
LKRLALSSTEPPQLGINGAGRNIRSLFEPLPPAGIPSVSASLRRADCAPDFFRCGGHVDMGDAERAERVDDRVRDGGECPTLPALAGTLTPKGLVLVGAGFSSI